VTDPDPIRVLVVDDHPVVRAGLRTLLDAQPGLCVVGAAGDGETALAMVQECRPEVVLCDLRLGNGPDGVAVTRSVRELGPTAPEVVILSTFDHDADIVRAMEAGAAGYLLKNAAPEDTVSVIRRAWSGESVLSAAMRERLISAMRSRRAGLSERELEVLRLVAGGRSNKDIARRLFISEATVKTHLNHAYGKLAVDNRTAAVAAARSAGLLD
jgi:DNA-binding NarL/FixJ family response regulator